MEGTVTIPVDEYNRLRDLSELIENEDIFRCDRNPCARHSTFYKISLEKFIAEKDETIKTWSEANVLYFDELKKLKDDFYNLKRQHEMQIEKNQDLTSEINDLKNKSFFERLFS